MQTRLLAIGTHIGAPKRRRVFNRAVARLISAVEEDLGDEPAQQAGGDGPLAGRAQRTRRRALWSSTVNASMIQGASQPEGDGGRRRARRRRG